MSDGTVGSEAGHGEGPEREAGASPDDRLGAGRAARERQRGVPARRDRPDQLLRLEAALSAAWAGRAEGPAAGREVASDDDPARGGGTAAGAGARAPGLWLQPAGGDARPGRPAGLGDHHPEDPERPRPRDPRAALAGAGDQDRERADRAHHRAGRLPREAEPVLSRTPRRERCTGRAAVRRHLHGRRAQRHRPGLPARCRGHLRLLRVRLPPRLQAAGGSGRRPAQRSAAVLPEPRPARAGSADRQRPRVLRHRTPPLRALPGAQRDRAPYHQGRHAQDQRLRRALQRHRPAGVLPAGHAPETVRERGQPAGRPRRLAAPLQHVIATHISLWCSRE